MLSSFVSRSEAEEQDEETYQNWCEQLCSLKRAGKKVIMDDAASLAIVKQRIRGSDSIATETSTEHGGNPGTESVFQKDGHACQQKRTACH